MKRIDLTDAKAIAVAAAKSSSRWAYCHNYVTGDTTISVREPNNHTLYLTSVHSWDFAKHAGCSGRAALNRLDLLAKAGLIIEWKERGQSRRFTLHTADAVAIGREIIAELREEGLPFEDEWRARKAAQAVIA